MTEYEIILAAIKRENFSHSIEIDKGGWNGITLTLKHFDVKMEFRKDGTISSIDVYE